MTLPQPSVLLFVGATVTAQRRSGVQRVVVELGRRLPAFCRLDLVCWDTVEARLRFADAAELDGLFGPGCWPEGVVLRPECRRVGGRFGDLVEAGAWLVNAEIAYHVPDGEEILARIVSQCREYGVRIASIFYDLIPLKHPAYAGSAAAHSSYLAGLSRSDLIAAISAFSATELAQYYTRAGVVDPPVIKPLPLGEPAEHGGDGAPTDELILAAGTIEPRKRQVELVRAYAAARSRSPAVARLPLVLSGSLHPVVAEPFRALVSRTPGVSYLDYAPARVLDDLYRRAAFTVFASEEEGYGLPIIESLAHGTPCICAGFGAMGEVAANGGCLTVDVRDHQALTSAIVRLAEDVDLRRRLRRETAGRPRRTWEDYARELVALLAASGEQAADLPENARTAVCDTDADAVRRLTDDEFRALAEMDVVGFISEPSYEAFVDSAEDRGWPSLLPSRIVVSTMPHLKPLLAEERTSLSAFRRRLDEVARTETRYARLRRTLPQTPRSCFLRIVISTYGRLPFVRENVRWLLDEVIRSHPDVELAVVDNASPDETGRELRRAFAGRDVDIRINAANVGMLGNLRTCAGLTGAEYVWIVGDDDFIVAEQMSPLLRGLRAAAGAPLAFVNFGVYHRTALSPRERADDLIKEAVPLSTHPAASGPTTVRRAAEQHDNLFTAIYPTIWRADVLAAAFDHPFNGRPFSTMEECIPSTLAALGTYASCETYWHAPVTIAGNAHNSWASHRPRWHGRIMPEALELAREAGVDPGRLGPWARTQGVLFDEALDIARGAGTDLDLDDDDGRMRRVLRRSLADRNAA